MWLVIYKLLLISYNTIGFPGFFVSTSHYLFIIFIIRYADTFQMFEEHLYRDSDLTLRSFVIRLMGLKYRFKKKFPDALLGQLLILLQDAFPKPNRIPASLSEFQSIVKRLIPTHTQEIHICRKGCRAFINEEAQSSICKVCLSNRFKACKNKR